MIFPYRCVPLSGSTLFMRLSVLCLGFVGVCVPSVFALTGTITGNAADGQANSDGTVSATTVTYGRLGADSGIRHSVIHVFQIPTTILNDATQQFTAATYRTAIGSISASAVNGDLYGLGYSINPAISSADFYEGVSDSTSVLLKDNFLTPSTPWYSSATESGVALVTHLNDCLTAARAAGATSAYVFIRLSLDAYSWSTLYTIGMAEAGGTSVPSLAYTTASTVPPVTTQTVSGNLAVAGNLSAAGNSVAFGTQGSQFGFSMNYTPGAVSSIDFSASSSAANWLWRQGEAPQLKLSNANVLTLYNPSSGAAGITLNPAGYSGFGTATPTAKLDVVGDIKVSGKVRIPQSGDLSMGGFTSGTNPAQ